MQFYVYTRTHVSVKMQLLIINNYNAQSQRLIKLSITKETKTRINRFNIFLFLPRQNHTHEFQHAS